jgi:hypothetical protein
MAIGGMIVGSEIFARLRAPRQRATANISCPLAAGLRARKCPPDSFIGPTQIGAVQGDDNEATLNKRIVVCHPM